MGRMKVENWPSLLDGYIKERKKESFSFGKFDCVRFVSDGIKLITDGFDPLASYRSKYRTEAGAARLIRKMTKEGTFKACVEKVLSEKGLKEVGKNYLKRGDIVLAAGTDPNGEYETVVGIFLGEHFVYADPVFGLSYTGIEHILKGWSI
jgi:hypothetical protein